MLQVLKSSWKACILFWFSLLFNHTVSRWRPRRPCCQLSILISYFSLQQMEVCPLYFLCISPSEWRLNPREADRLLRSARGELGLLRLPKVLGVSVLTAGEAMRLMFFVFFFARCSAHCCGDGRRACEVFGFSELITLDKTDPSRCSPGYVVLFEEHVWETIVGSHWQPRAGTLIDINTVARMVNIQLWGTE